MDSSTLELALCQLLKISEASQKNHHVYSDDKKDYFHKQIESLLADVAKVDFETLSDNDKNLHRQLFDNLLVWLEFLDSSTLNNTPYEIIKCLEVVLHEWLDETEFKRFVIVTIPQSKQISYSYWDPELGNQLTDYLKEKYSKEIVNTLIPINLPKYLVHDYLANVTLYHEIGHFIDRHYKISQKIVDFDVTYKDLDAEAREKQYNHLSEFFADMFASQYISDKCSIYLNHIAHDEVECDTHPSTAARVDLINSFLSDEPDKNIIIKMIRDYTKKIAKRDLIRGRYKDISLNEFEDLLPNEVTEREQLHHLLIQGWDTWYKKNGNIRDTFPSAMNRYKVINNLIEKSISNFIVKEKWKKENVSNKEGHR